MTAKEKANELVYKYVELLKKATPSLNRTIYNAKKCALIAVDEIINALKPLSPVEGMSDADYEIRDWGQVKEKIKKL